MSSTQVPSHAHRPSAWILAFLVPVVLACSGLPIPGAVTGGGEGDPTGPDPEPGEPEGDGEGEGDAEEPEGDQPTADSLFPALDPNEAPPYERGSVKCPAPTMVIRHPKGGRLTVYCATGSGVRSGPYTEWQKSTLVVSATNVEGKLDGAWSRWEKGEGDAVRKVEHQTWVAGQQTGDYAEWDVTGRLLVRGKTVDGKRDGLFVERKVEGEAVVFGGACYQAGTEVWRTADEAEFVSKDCGGGDTVAEG